MTTHTKECTTKQFICVTNKEAAKKVLKELRLKTKKRYKLIKMEVSNTRNIVNKLCHLKSDTKLDENSAIMVNLNYKSKRRNGCNRNLSPSPIQIRKFKFNKTPIANTKIGKSACMSSIPYITYFPTTSSQKPIQKSTYICLI